MIFFIFPATALAAEPTGRLFFTPAQRAQLDVARSDKHRAVFEQEKQPVPLPETVTYSGVVRRSDGKSTVWINNRAINERELAGSDLPVTGRVRPDGALTLRIPQTDQRVDLKVGQSAEIVSGTIEEPYSRHLPAASPPQTKPAAGGEAGAAQQAPAGGTAKPR
ncbi:MAG: hypothetical protein KIT18_12945 [Burkholderiales bacterium]|nr:hypothetical protein [Burkholderiales bacterium]